MNSHFCEHCWKSGSGSFVYAQKYFKTILTLFVQKLLCVGISKFLLLSKMDRKHNFGIIILNLKIQRLSIISARKGPNKVKIKLHWDIDEEKK